MPYGQPYPPPDQGSSESLGDFLNQGVSELLGDLQAWSGSGSGSQFQHNSLFPGSVTGSIVAQQFLATALVIDNPSPYPIVVGVGRHPTLTASGYDLMVRPNSVLVTRIQPTSVIWLLQGSVPDVGVALPVEVYLLAGSMAAVCPPYAVYEHRPPDIRPSYAIGEGVGDLSTPTALEFAGGDPFASGSTISYLDRIIVSAWSDATAADGIFLVAPPTHGVGGGAVGAMLAAPGAGGSPASGVYDMGGVPVGAPNDPGRSTVAQYLVFSGPTPVDVIVQVIFIYRPSYLSS